MCGKKWAVEEMFGLSNEQLSDTNSTNIFMAMVEFQKVLYTCGTTWHCTTFLLFYCIMMDINAYICHS